MTILKNLLATLLILSLSFATFANDDENTSLVVSPGDLKEFIQAINNSMYNTPTTTAKAQGATWTVGGDAEWTMDPDLIDKQTFVAAKKPTYESIVFMFILLEFYIEQSTPPKSGSSQTRSNAHRNQAINNALKVLARLSHIASSAFTSDYQYLIAKLSTPNYELAKSGLESHLSNALNTSKEKTKELHTNLSTINYNNLKRIIYDITSKDGAFPGDKPTQSRIQKINNIIVTTSERIVKERQRKDFLSSISKRSPKNYEQLKKSMDSFKKIINEQLLGQPETVESLTSMRRSALLKGQEQANAIVLLGEPGSGKDTAAIALTDAIHDRVGAYKDHMFTLDPMTKDQDLSKIFGSSTGYLGSGDLPPFLEFLVMHSGGRYEIEAQETRSGFDYHIVENENWKPGQAIQEGTYAPHEAVVFVNEFHNWTKDMKDTVFKLVLQKDGYFTVNNPSGGVSKLYVPVNFVIATNDGIELLSARDIDGNRVGAPLSYKDRIKKWETAHDNKEIKKQSLSRQNGTGTSEKPMGISEELLNRFPNIILMRPHSPENMKKIAAKITTSLEKSFSRGMLSNISFDFSANVHDFLVDYDFSSEDGIRFVEQKIIDFIQNPLTKAIDTEDLEIPTSKTTWALEYVKNNDLTTSLKVIVTSGEDRTEVLLDLPSTQKDKLREPLSQEKVKEILALEEEINKKVFGVSHITPQLIEVALETEEKLNEKIEDEYKNGKKANVMMFLGKSSTGKTYLAETYGKLKHGDKSKVVTIDFGQISSKDALNKEILGNKDHNGRSVPSTFMQEYDRAGGKITFIFDEVANTHPDILKALYDVLRQPIVTTFSDGKERSMAGVDIIMTGNAGEEIYNEIPKDIPDNQKLAAMNRAYEVFMNNAGSRRGILEKFFSDAFLNRVGERNIFFFGPLSYKSLRQVTQLKLEDAFRSLSKTGNGKKSWNLQMSSAQDLTNFYEIIERAGFVIDEQGASVDKFVKESLETKLRSLLIRNGIPTGETVTLKTLTTEPKIMPNGNLDFSYDIAVFVGDSKEPLVLKLDGKKRPLDSKIRETNQIITAYHETGHELVRKVLLGFDYEGQEITVIPGVDNIGGRIVHYLGVARSQQKYQPEMTREYAVRRIAVLTAGYIAESIVTKGARHTAGKSNDMLRATEIAKKAVAKWGLSEVFGTSAVGPEETMDTFYEKLSKKKKKIFQKEVDALISEGAYLAREALTVNNKAFIVMGRQLAEQGTLNKTDLNNFYSDNTVLVESDAGYLEAASSLSSEIEAAENAVTEAKKTKVARVKSRGTLLEIKAENLKPNTVANIDSIIASEKSEAIAEVELSQEIAIAAKDTFNVDKLVSINSKTSGESNNSQVSACARALK